MNILTANARVDLKTKYPNVHVSLFLSGTADTDFHRVAGTPSRPVAGTRLGAFIVETADHVADKIAWLIDNPVPEFYAIRGMLDVVQRYYQDVGKFEDEMTRTASA